jgi:hypothetical protein
MEDGIGCQFQYPWSADAESGLPQINLLLVIYLSRHCEDQALCAVVY